MKKKYTKDTHAARLIKMLEKRWPSGKLGCPAARRYDSTSSPDSMWLCRFDNGSGSPPKDACDVCMSFLGLDSRFERFTYYGDLNCPCRAFKSCAEAAKRSWLRLEEEGYI